MSLEEVKARLAHAALLLDFDGTLSPIVVRSEEAMPVAGAEEVLAGLVERAGNVTIVTGRRSGFIRSVLRVDGLEVIGQFGMEDSPALPEEVLAEVNAAVAGESGVRVVDKSASIAIHVRTTPDPDAATARIAGPLTAIAERDGLEVLPGKRVLELVPKGSSKGVVVEKVVARTGSRGCALRRRRPQRRARVRCAGGPREGRHADLPDRGGRRGDAGGARREG